MQPTRIRLRRLANDDWGSVVDIYRQGIDSGHATFEQELPTWEEWDDIHLKVCRIVAEVNAVVVGWGALLPVSGRSVYAGVAEVSIYVAVEHRGFGIGTRVLEELITESEQHGLWTLQASIFPKNIPSIKMHQALGFRTVGYREKIGKMHRTWRDTVLLERRSTSTGIS
jgi:phosphinothricin acetyltransferase